MNKVNRLSQAPRKDPGSRAAVSEGQAWNMPSGIDLAEFALRVGFLAPRPAMLTGRPDAAETKPTTHDGSRRHLGCMAGVVRKLR